MRDVVALLKLNKVYRLLLSVGLGVVVALPIPRAQWREVAGTAVGGLAAAAAANVLNMYFDRDLDAGCTRTMHRPLACGRLAPRPALAIACGLAGIAAVTLTVFARPAVGVAVTAAALCYVVVYTCWLKRRSVAYTLVGGALWAAPIPIMWWAAEKPSLSMPLWVFVVVALWVALHTWLAGMLNPEEYRVTGVRFLPVAYGLAPTRGVIVWVALAITAASLASGITGLQLLSGMLLLAAALSWVSASRRADVLLHKVAVGYVAGLTVLLLLQAVMPPS